MNSIINFKQNLNDIVFIFDNKELVSLFTTDGDEIASNQINNKNAIYFKLNSINFDYIKNNSVYCVIYSKNIEENLAQRCHLNLYFYKCSPKCDLCTSNGKCFDKYWNKIEDEPDIDNNSSEKSSFIYVLIPIILFVIIIIVIILHAFLCKKKIIIILLKIMIFLVLKIL